MHGAITMVAQGDAQKGLMGSCIDTLNSIKTKTGQICQKAGTSVPPVHVRELIRKLAAQVYNNQFGPESHIEKALEALSS